MKDEVAEIEESFKDVDKKVHGAEKVMGKMLTKYEAMADRVV